MFDDRDLHVSGLGAHDVSYAGRVPGRPAPDDVALIALLRERPAGLGWAQLAEAVLEHGGARAAREALVDGALFSDGAHERRLAEAAVDLQGWQDRGLEFWSITGPRYPARVREIHQSPPFLFARGHRVTGDELAVSVVGSRRASEHGRSIARRTAAALTAMDVTVISGLAAGIDTVAHQTTLEQGGRTVAVIGTGLGRAYPAANRDLQERIATEGLVLSQFWPEAPPQPHNFPMRNAVMSGLGIATVVVEAGEHSGARIQARLAVEHGRPVILTDLVVRATEWGRKLRDRPDVFVAQSTDEIIGIVEELIARPGLLTEAFRQIAV